MRRTAGMGGVALLVAGVYDRMFNRIRTRVIATRQSCPKGWGQEDGSTRSGGGRPGGGVGGGGSTFCSGSRHSSPKFAMEL